MTEPTAAVALHVRSETCHAHLVGADHFAQAVITGTAVTRFAERHGPVRPPSLAILPLDASRAPNPRP